jgi:protein-serine/threonine kinase
MIVNGNGEHFHTLGADAIPSKRRKHNLPWFQKEPGQEDLERLIPPKQRETEQDVSESFSERYGVCKGIIHYGANATIRLHRKSVEELYAIKVYHRSHPMLDLNPDIGTDLRHRHIVKMNEFSRDKHDHRYLSMEYCVGGDLLSLILSSESGRLEKTEADCFFAQIIQGVTYLHERGIAHRNLQPKSIALTVSGCVKIIDFDRALSVFTLSEIKYRTGLSRYLSSQQNSAYMAPEQYIRFSQVDPRASDVWAVGIVYLAMRRGHIFWNVAQITCDPRYDDYVKRRSEECFVPIETLEEVSLTPKIPQRRYFANNIYLSKTTCRNVIYAMLDPKYYRRILASEVLRSEWVQRIVICDAGGCVR